MAINIDTITINDGDPVSAEIIQKMNANINKVALGEKISIINISNTTGTSGNVKAYGVTFGSSLPVTVPKGNYVSKTVDLTPYSLKETPSIMLQILNPNVGIKNKHVAVLKEVTKTSFTFYVLADSAMTSASDGCTVYWIAFANVEPAAASS